MTELATSEESSEVRIEGNRSVKRKFKNYSLDAIIAVGYRVNSAQATRFRIWATKVLKEYIIKGFALDDERLKQAKTVIGKDYFRELLEIVVDRASEQRIRLQVTEIFAACSINYDKNSEEARQFFATVQNLFHYAITGKTAAEIIHSTANRNKPNMGLTTWKGAPDGRIYKYDLKVAKNYLDEKAIKELERAVNGFFDYIERQIELKKELKITKDMANLVIKFLTFNDYQILEGNGSVSSKQALRKAYAEYDEFKTQRMGVDFAKFIEEVKQIEK